MMQTLLNSNMMYKWIVTCLFLIGGSLAASSAPPPKPKQPGPDPFFQQQTQQNKPTHQSKQPLFPTKQLPNGEPQPLSFLYSAPGIATMQGGEWVGTEHLFNIKENLGIYVELVATANPAVTLTESGIAEKVAAIFRAGGLSPKTSFYGPPLPFFHVLIMLQPIEKGFVAYCAGRLLEEIQIARIFLKPGITWQAITWEKQELVLSPSDQINAQIEKTVLEFATGFANRYKEQNDKKR